MKMKDQNSKGFTFKERKTRRGFTLIELLVVMTIIVILAGLSLVSYQGAQRSARDGKRKADLEQIRSALEMCYADDDEYSNTTVPRVRCNISGNIYLDPTPDDPIPAGSYHYALILSKTSYYLCAYLENSNPGSCPGTHSCGLGTCNYGVASP